LCFVGDRRSLSVACAFGRRSAIAGRLPTQKVGLLRWPALPFQRSLAYSKALSVACRRPYRSLVLRWRSRSALPLGRLSFFGDRRSLSVACPSDPLGRLASYVGLAPVRSLVLRTLRSLVLWTAIGDRRSLSYSKALSVASRRPYRSLALAEGRGPRKG
jgi:hypothetical protein